MCLLLKREKQKKESRVVVLLLSFASHALEKNIRFLNSPLQQIHCFTCCVSYSAILLKPIAFHTIFTQIGNYNKTNHLPITIIIQRLTRSILSLERIGFGFLQLPKYAVDVNFSYIFNTVFLAGADLDLNFARNSR